MKLIYFANTRVPSEWAHGIQIMKMCEAFASYGVDVELVVPNRYSAITEDPFAYYAVQPIFTITRLGKLSRLSNRLTHLWSLISFSVRAGLYAGRRKPDIIYSRDEGLLFFLSFFFRNLVWEVHGWKGNRRVRRLGRRLNHIIAITEAAKRRFVESGIAPDKMLVASDGIDESFFHVETDIASVRRQFGLPLEGYVVMYIGLLTTLKGYATLASAAPLLKKQGITVVIVGGDEIQARALRIQYPDVIFLGFIPYKRLSFLQSAADILVIPNSAKSIVSTDYTSPLKLFAHMASGRPIVASDLPSLREILDEETAYFFEPDNSESLAKVIEHVMTHPEEAQKKAREACVIVKEYTWEKRARRILDFIRI